MLVEFLKRMEQCEIIFVDFKKHIMKNFLFVFGIAFLLVSCSDKTKNKANSEGGSENDSAVEECVFEIQNAFTKLEWEAYKTTARVPVKGSFDDIKINAGAVNSSAKDILNGLSFEIAVGSTNSNNEERDPKIVEHFFGAMMNTDFIKGEITSLDGNDSVGKARIAISMNDMTHAVDADYTIDGVQVKLGCLISLGDWKAETAVQSLNAVCDDLHKGDDGVSKLWPEVQVTVVSTLKKNCSEAVAETH